MLLWTVSSSLLLFLAPICVLGVPLGDETVITVSPITGPPVTGPSKNDSLVTVSKITDPPTAKPVPVSTTVTDPPTAKPAPKDTTTVSTNNNSLPVTNKTIPCCNGSKEIVYIEKKIYINQEDNVTPFWADTVHYILALLIMIVASTALGMFYFMCPENWSIYAIVEGAFDDDDCKYEYYVRKEIEAHEKDRSRRHEDEKKEKGKSEEKGAPSKGTSAGTSKAKSEVSAKAKAAASAAVNSKIGASKSAVGGKPASAITAGSKLVPSPRSSIGQLGKAKSVLGKPSSTVKGPASSAGKAIPSKTSAPKSKVK